MTMRLILMLALVSVVLSQKLFFKSLKELKDTEEKVTLHDKVVPCPNNTAACPDGNTCCMLVTRSYGCCSLPMATCCTDGKHCCPRGLRCDLFKKACINGDTNIPWGEQEEVKSLTKIEKKEDALESQNRAVICPDGERECESGNTCCQSDDGFACCSFPDAVCCSDNVHCCPKGTVCDMSHSRCLHKNGDVFLTWFDKKSSKKPQQMTQPQVKAVQCDASHQCPTGNTCCKLPTGQWGCCPQPNAVCCSDQVHCCPGGTTCDVSSGKCNRGNLQTDWLEKTPAIEVGAVQCDSTHVCPSGNTCCKLASGQWGCCPIPNAVCCSDHVHCCPSGTTCDVSSGKCNRGNLQTDWLEKTPAIEVGAVQCDSTHVCPSGNTCCKLASGQWGCCPIPNAVCCSDHVHCCPSGTTCDVSSGKCNRGNLQTDWLEKTPAIEVGAVKCDSTHVCPSSNTCCKLASGQWGCCPIPNAACCSDQVHCCPSGTTCDVSSGKCNRGNLQTDWLEKTPVIEVGAVHCDSTHECPSGHTCCKLASGRWGCCPQPNAVCCSDHVHCCPSGTTCDVSSGKCNQGNLQLEWFEKSPAIEVRDVQCDSTHYCPSGDTCCQLASGQWGCCPQPNAVCCSDHVHCCPSGTTCDVSSGKCSRGNLQLDWFEKTPAIEVRDVQCDSTHYCPSGDTCCQLASGQWGCCPQPNAVCCSDHVHCCPSGTTCDVSSGKCSRGNLQLDWFEKTPAIEVRDVQCDSTHYCPSGDTCCQLASGQWGCCPQPNAVCCSDHVHCCPSGTTCDVSSGKCSRGNLQLDWFEKTPAIEVRDVQCDSTHYCPSGDTCCQLASGQWGCCPQPNAVCCSDHVHCCPSGTTCDVSSGKCSRGNLQLDWFEKSPAIEVRDVQCDSTHYCPSGDTCCKLASGQWGCCPQPNAVCCSDHVHCCPSGTTCDVSSGKCSRGNLQLDWFEKSPAIEVRDVQCDSTHYCPSGDTCCQLASGQWGCCPQPNAVCCSDHVHCCPSGTTCDVSSGKCSRGNLQLDWFEKSPAIEVRDVQCDSTHYCPSGDTCCQLASGQWGCCPQPNAVCCSDHVHCCPSGTTCDVSSGKCSRGNLQLDWFEKTPAIEVRDVQCDSTHYCPSGDTCCQLASGQWGCCPQPNAVCCSDHVHCCPSGTTCDVSSGKCSRGNLQLDWFEKSPAIEVRDVQCDSTHYCPSGDTCCKLASGQWGCCPQPNAVCCSDHVHCCPSGTTCDVSSGKCSRGNLQLDWFEKTPAIEVRDVQCDPTHYCPSGDTCCQLASGQWGCCPQPNAVCCSDHVHCCPSGTTCDVSSGKCNRGNLQLDWFEKTPAIEVRDVQCDSTHYCPSGDTCCQLSSGQWGCCPQPNAVCCSDHVHCCPSGTTCDVSSGKCNRGNLQIDWFEKTPANEIRVVHCDSTHYCPQGNTCCKLASGQWGCCPIPNAVCCSDQVHCCPSGTTCDVSSGKCNQGNLQIDWLEKTPATVLAVEVDNVQCDSSHFCKDGTTCCKLSNGGWGCCPLPNAVCCSDQVHCCPGGTTCDVSSGKCNRGNLQIDWFEKTPANEIRVVHCDSTHYCPSGNTCCKLASGQWGCCPIPNAVCCSDQVHCCPSGTTCDVSSGKCNQGNLQIDWLEKTPATVLAVEVDNVQCDSSHFCKDGTTCCKLSNGGWGCCPLPNAVCCSDQVHCCPGGTTCDVSSGKCNRGNLQIDWFEKTPANEIRVVHCDSTHYCPSGNTCCKLASGQWGCCPIPNAVCCSDQVHCCPSGTTCDVSSGKCNQGNLQIDWLEKTPATVLAVEVDNVQCDSSHFCKDGTTCCKLSNGGWGCCPLPNAVCCSDQVHCCPGGTTCDVSSGKCNRGNLQIDWFEKTPANEIRVVHCDSTHYCPSGNTCCKLASGQWGCCPIPNAVCCSDQVHCCPRGTTCNVSSGKCNQGNLQIDWLEKTPATVLAVEVDNVQCDSSHFCKDGTTCCKLSNGGWGCCPLPNAVCCSDQVHCCPGGTTCDVSSGKCNRGNLQIDWFEKIPATVVAIEVDNVQCDSSHVCKDGTTCCKLSNGGWGCCPLPNAVCCSDHVHCCPSGTTCDVSSGKCNRGNLQTDWSEKIPAIVVAVEVGNVQCDSSHFCKDRTTCCKLSNGGWGCCPLPNAVCCSDHVHCCPSGTTCDVSSGKCNRGNLQIDWSEKTPATVVAVEVGNVQCDSSHFCKDRTTCCKLSNGEWGCCPLPNAVCCSDHVHCCPSGTTCDVSSGKCNRGHQQIDWFTKEKSFLRVEKLSDVICPDGSECQDGQTCCLMGNHETASYGCCPLPNAVCCNDNKHCCPSGYRCNVGSGTCVRGIYKTQWLKTVTSQKKNMQGPLQGEGHMDSSDDVTALQGEGHIDSSVDVKVYDIIVTNVPCAGTSEGCLDGFTCCAGNNANYKCCPYSKAVCCPDKQHCCPHGYICDEEPGICRIPETSSAGKFLNKLYARKGSPIR